MTGQGHLSWVTTLRPAETREGAGNKPSAFESSSQPPRFTEHLVDTMCPASTSTLQGGGYQDTGTQSCLFSFLFFSLPGDAIFWDLTLKEELIM